MGLLDFIFGNDEDDLEKTETKHPLESVPYFQRPISSSTSDPQVGEDDVGNPVFRTATGSTYTVRLNPDQRTLRQKVVDTAPVVAEAVKNYAQNPTLPSKEQVGQFAYDATVGAAEDLGNVMFRGEGTMGDVVSLATGVGVGARGANVVSKALTGDGIVPEGEPGTVLGLFLPAIKNTKYASKVQLADELKARGVSRDEIWEKTGLWQLGEKGNWLTEIDDSKSEIFLTAKFAKEAPPKRFKEETVTEQRAVKTGTLSDQDRLSAKIDTRKKMLDLRDRLDRGEISENEAKLAAKSIQQELDDLLAKTGQTTYEDVEVTKKVEIPRKPLTVGRGPQMKGGKSKLDEVLLHDKFFDEMSEMGIDVSKTTAEAGRRLDTSAGENAAGVQYRTEPEAYEDRNRVNSFKNSAGWKNSPRNDADRALYEAWKLGEISTEQIDAEMILSTMLHEVQHLIDAEVLSDTGTGFNWTGSKQVREQMKDKLEGDKLFLVNTKPKTDSRRAISLVWNLVKKPVDVEDTIGGSILSPAKADKFEISDIVESVYGDWSSLSNTKVPKEISSAWPNIGIDDIQQLSVIFNDWKQYKRVLASFSPNDPNWDTVKADAKFEFIKRISGTVEKGEISADFYNSNSIFSPSVNMSNPPKNVVQNRRLRANAIFHTLDAGYLDEIIEDYDAILTSPLSKNVTASDKEIYFLEGGEAKSRLVQARRDMTAEERKKIPPYKMLDRNEEQIWFADTYGRWDRSLEQ